MYGYRRIAGVVSDILERARQVRGEYAEEFLQQLRQVPYDDSKGVQGPPASLQRIISVWVFNTGAQSIQQLYDEWELDHKSALRRAEMEQLKASTFVVQYSSGSKFGKPERMPKDDLHQPWKPGFLLLDERGKIQGRDFDSDFGPRLTIKTLPIGQEIDPGTIKHKRLIKTDSGPIIQYLVKPRSGPAQKRYEAGKELAKLELQLRADIDGLLPAPTRERIQAEIEKLRKIVKKAMYSYDRTAATTLPGQLAKAIAKAVQQGKVDSPADLRREFKLDLPTAQQVSGLIPSYFGPKGKGEAEFIKKVEGLVK